MNKQEAAMILHPDTTAQAAPAGSGAGAIGRMKPILFSTPMVQAILAGRKTMVRMPIKHQPDKSAQFMRISCGRACFETDTDMWNMMLPYNFGDVLWVRESFRPITATVTHWSSGETVGEPEYHCGYQYLSDSAMYFPDGFTACDDEFTLTDIKYGVAKSPVAMPRSAARMFLRVTDARVERLKSIPEDDVVREGFCDEYDLKTDIVCPDGRRFRAAWDARNAKRGYGWDSNPWVWVIEFERSEGA